MKKDKFIVIDTIRMLFETEIDNFFICSDNEITIWLKDNSKVKISAKNLSKKEYAKLKRS